MSFRFEKLEIPEVILVEGKAFTDHRGFFQELYKRSLFVPGGITPELVQDNLSFSKKGVLRGLHYQKLPQPQGKLVSVIAGEILDVAVDIRKGSPSYGKHVSALLSADNRRMLWVPPGFAHAFCVTSETAHVLYKVTAEFAPELDRGVAYNDPTLGIRWPVTDPVVSEKDAKLPPLAQADNNFVYEGAR